MWNETHEMWNTPTLFAKQIENVEYFVAKVEPLCPKVETFQRNVEQHA